MEQGKRIANLRLLEDDDDDERPREPNIRGSLPKKPKPISETKGAEELTKVFVPEDFISPLQYMLQVMNDEDADTERRDKMAAAAAPYVHPRIMSYQGKKERDEKENAKTINGSDWNNILEDDRD